MPRLLAPCTDFADWGRVSPAPLLVALQLAISLSLEFLESRRCQADPVTPSAAALGRLLLRWDVLYRYRYEASIPKSVRGGYFFAPAFCAAAQTQKSPVVRGLCWGGATRLADGAGVVPTNRWACGWMFLG